MLSKNLILFLSIINNFRLINCDQDYPIDYFDSSQSNQHYLNSRLIGSGFGSEEVVSSNYHPQNSDLKTQSQELDLYQGQIQNEQFYRDPKFARLKASGLYLNGENREIVLNILKGSDFEEFNSFIGILSLTRCNCIPIKDKWGFLSGTIKGRTCDNRQCYQLTHLASKLSSARRLHFAECYAIFECHNGLDGTEMNFECFENCYDSAQ